MRSAGNGQFVQSIKNEIEKLGYEVSHCTLNAADFGVPQLRNRLFFVGVRKGIQFEWPAGTYGTKSRPYLTVRDAIGDLPSLTAGEESRKYTSAPKNAFQQKMRIGVKGELTNHRAPNHPAATIKKIAKTKPGQPIYPKFTQRIRLSWEAPSPTQVSGGIRPQFQFGHPASARGLTVRERCRLQSFPDNFFLFGGTVQGRVQTGNAVPPLLAKAVALKIKEALG